MRLLEGAEMKFKTYGSMFSALQNHMSSAVARSDVSARYGSNSFYKRNLALHEAFEEFCIFQGINAVELREGIIKYVKNNGCPFSKLQTFLDTLPNEFNVRGVWTPRGVN